MHLHSRPVLKKALHAVLCAGKIYALKQMSKGHIIDNKLVAHVHREKNVSGRVQYTVLPMAMVPEQSVLRMPSPTPPSTLAGTGALCCELELATVRTLNIGRRVDIAVLLCAGAGAGAVHD